MAYMTLEDVECGDEMLCALMMLILCRNIVMRGCDIEEIEIEENNCAMKN